MDPLLSSSMQQAPFKCEMPRLELVNLWTFLDIKGCQGTKRKKVIKQSQSSLIKKAGAYVRHQKAIRIKHAFFCNWLCFIFY
jgi:hypothetical protein